MKITLQKINKDLFEVDVSDDGTIKDIKEALHTKYSFDSERLKLIFQGKVLCDTDGIKAVGIDETKRLVFLEKKVTGNQDLKRKAPEPQTVKKVDSMNLSKISKRLKINEESLGMTGIKPAKKLSDTIGVKSTETNKSTNQLENQSEIDPTDKATTETTSSSIPTSTTETITTDSTDSTTKITKSTPNTLTEDKPQNITNALNDTGNSEVSLDNLYDDVGDEIDDGTIKLSDLTPNFQKVVQNKDVLEYVLNNGITENVNELLIKKYPEVEKEAREHPKELEKAIAYIFQMLNPVLDELCGNIEFCDDEDIDDEDVNDEDEDGEIEHENGSQDETQPFQNVELTPKDEAAISRLMELGFTKEQAIQCYFIANKDENLAAELLLG